MASISIIITEYFILHVFIYIIYYNIAVVCLTFPLRPTLWQIAD